LVILPGTHSKHVTVHNSQIVGFWTFMTGELYEVLGQHSILRHSIAPVAIAMTGDTLMAFRSGVEWAGARPLSAALFRVRTRQVLDHLDPMANRAFLSGLLVASELSYLAGEAWSGMPLVLCAAEPLAGAYAEACEVLGLRDRLTTIDPTDVARLSALGQACLLRRIDSQSA
jgi:2-dehydro-3-deoxygalactonokinase